MRRFWQALTLLWLTMPAWARLGGGGGYRSSSSSRSSWSSSSSSRSSWSSSSSSSSGWGGGSHGGGTYHSSGGAVHASFWDIIIPLFFITVVVVGLYLAAKASSNQESGQSGCFPGMSCGTLGICGLLFLFNPPLMGLALLAYFVMTKKGSDGVGAAAFGRLSDAFGGVANPLTPTKNVNPYAAVLRMDPNFSVPIFREFAVLLYCQAMQERPGGGFVHSRPFLGPKAVDMLSRRCKPDVTVSDVVVGAFRVRNSEVGQRNVVMSVAFESNYIEQSSSGTRAFIARETWIMERRQGVLTRAPKAVSSLACPSCGYAGDIPADGVCPTCQTTNVRGEFDWVVTSVMVESLEPFTPHSAEGGGVEEGTQLPTVIHPELGRRREEFLTRHPDFSWPEFCRKASGIFLKLQQGWSERNVHLCRPHETDVLFRQHRYWIEDLKRHGKINRLSDVVVDRWELSNLVIDAYYESLTARVFASMIDVTTDETGKVLYGDPRRPRKFTEYWTFIRRIGSRPPSGDSLHQCPSCGAPLDKITQSGECEYCQRVVTLGDFDWVLTNIEQDEIYSLEL